MGFVIYSKFLETVYRYGQVGYDPNPAEARISFLYKHLDNMPVWTWDRENYGEDNKDMIGFFYEEDLHNIKQLEQWLTQLHIDLEKQRSMKKI